MHFSVRWFFFMICIFLKIIIFKHSLFIYTFPYLKMEIYRNEEKYENFECLYSDTNVWIMKNLYKFNNT